MMLIAESGSTKTNWAIVRDGHNTSIFSTNGLNPVTQSAEHISNTILNEVIPKLEGFSPRYIAFYGAGISSSERVAIMESSLKAVFPSAILDIEHDLMGAARAAYEGENTIVAILGTGSNSCVYDGNTIVSHIPSLGYILGDEGSGAHLGKTLLKDYIYGKFPKNLSDDFNKQYSITVESIVKHVYRSPNPNRWLASYSPFILKHIGQAYFRDLVLTSFRQFFECHISAYSDYRAAPINAIGSIAFHFEDILKQVCSEFEFRFGRVIQSPIEELVRFHISQSSSK